MAPFHAKAELKQRAQAKILMSPILIENRVHQIVDDAYHQIPHFFMSQTTTIWTTPPVLLCFTSPLSF